MARAAAISEALLFKHFSKAALYEIPQMEREADQMACSSEPSTAALVELIRGMVDHFLEIASGPDQEEAQRLTDGHEPSDGEFARLLYAKIETLIERPSSPARPRGRRRRCAPAPASRSPVLVCRW
ncbi:hypothetical protein ACTGJ9_039555 [Bradyrhizobium sp. RDM12]